MNHTLSINHLAYQVKNKTLLHGVSFDLTAPQLCCLIGVNGSGKTTLLRLLAGLTAPSSGSIIWNGKPWSSFDLQARSRLVSWLPSQGSIAFGYTCREIMMLGRFNHHQGYPRKSDSELVSEIMQRFGITQHSDKPFPQLSSGEQRKVLIARTIASDTPVMILDEPLSHLDPKAAHEVMQALKSYSLAKLIVMSTHHIEHARLYADTIIALKQNTLHTVGRTDQVLTTALSTTLFGS